MNNKKILVSLADCYKKAESEQKHAIISSPVSIFTAAFKIGTRSSLILFVPHLAEQRVPSSDDGIVVPSVIALFWDDQTPKGDSPISTIK